MAKILYTAKIKSNTGELHIFKANPAPDNQCTPHKKSICEMMDLSESLGNKFACEDENNARVKSAQLGRKVCGVCVSSLYETY